MSNLSNKTLKLSEPKDLNQYENEKVEERIEELINKGRVNKWKHYKKQSMSGLKSLMRD